MSSSEPRLALGDGPLDVRPAPVLGPPGSAPLDPGDLATGTAPAELPAPHGKRRDPPGVELPPLFSLNELLLDAPSWLFSAGLHLTLIIILGLLIFTPEKPAELLLQFDYREGQEDDFSSDDVDAPLDLSKSDLETALAPQQLPQLADPLTVKPMTVKTPLLTQPLPNDTEPIRLALTGRERGMQQALLDAYGGTHGTQQAVMEALKWLARNQGRQGLWSMTGRYSNGAADENQEAATAMALLAYQGAGYTPHGDELEPYTKVVARGWTGLLNQQDENGNFFHSGRASAQLYTQAICTIAICELYGMTGNSIYREPAQRAVNYCTKVQTPEGGWRYFPGTGSDLSVTGWFVMALQSARMAGLSMPSQTLSRVDSFLDSVSRHGGSQYAYQPAQSATLSMTAEGLLCRQYRGWLHADPRLQEGADLLVANLPRWDEGRRDVYYWYYATQVCHHMESQHWRSWNEVMRKLLPAKQEREGVERGSWDPRGDRWGAAGGRLFVTCLSTYMLEVYYRHLPIYQLDLLSAGP